MDKKIEEITESPFWEIVSTEYMNTKIVYVNAVKLEDLWNRELIGDNKKIHNIADDEHT